MKKILTIAALTVATACGTGHQVHESPKPTIKSTPCATEDSPGPCYWDAQHRGNGKGKSFRVLKNGKVEYLVAWTVMDRDRKVRVCGFDEQDVLSLDEEHYNDPTRDPKHDADCNER